MPLTNPQEVRELAERVRSGDHAAALEALELIDELIGDRGPLVRTELEACAPEELPAPTSLVDWRTTGEAHGFALVTISGRRVDVERFVADHWGPACLDELELEEV